MLPSGTTIGTYRIINLIGAGGMGEVYRAHDARLGRDVAIKVLPAELSGDPERRERVIREARAIAAINHPHIVTVHAVEEHGGVPFLAMELVEGTTLAELIPTRGLPVVRFLDLAVPLADAVAAAHRRGVLHRDLKPQNVMVRQDGLLKVLDFGLSKLRDVSPAFPPAEVTTRLESVAGRIAGTPPYMSPEQAEGRPLDHRTDLFSLGVILFEMATGQRPFKGHSDLATLASIVRDPPPSVGELRPDLPSQLMLIIGRLLAKHPQERYAEATEVARALRDVRAQVEPRAPADRRRSVTAGIVVALLAMAIATGLVWRWVSRTRSDVLPVVGEVTRMTFDDGIEQWPDISPDGHWIVYSKDGELFLRRAEAGQPDRLTNRDEGSAEDPAFSPDGRVIAYAVRRPGSNVRGGIWTIDRTDRSKRRVAEVGFAPAWSPDGREIAYTTEPSNPFNRARESRLLFVDIGTGATRRMNERDVMQPEFSPDGKRVVYWRQWQAGHRPGRKDIWVASASGADAAPLTDDSANDIRPTWSPDGRYIYYCSDRGGTMNLWRRRVDEASNRPIGEPQPVPTPAPIGHISFAADGRRFVYAVDDRSSNIHRVAFDSAAGVVRGGAEPIITGPRMWAEIDVGPDGRLVFVDFPTELYVSDAEGSNVRALTGGLAANRTPRWSPDGMRIAFSSNKGLQNLEVHTMRADCAAAEVVDAARRA